MTDLVIYNMYNLEDDVLEEKILWTIEWYEPEYYAFYEGDDIAVGQQPLRKFNPGMPSNYENINGQNQTIYQTDADNDEDNNDCDLPYISIHGFVLSME